MNWTIERPPGCPVRRTDDNRLAVPLRLSRTDGHSTDTELTLTLAEAEHLHAALCRALDGEPRLQPHRTAASRFRPRPALRTSWGALSTLQHR